jgi:hypothetical protein
LLAGVNIWMVVGFWSQLGGGDPLPYQIFGACLAAVEVTFLVVSADAQSRGEVAKARIWRVVFAIVLCLNLVADFGAIVTKTKADQQERAEQIAAYDAAVRAESESSQEIERLESALAAADLALPTAAIEARLHGVRERRQRYETQGLRMPRALVIETTNVEQALAIARSLERASAERREARDRLQRFGTRPETSNAQIEGLVELAGAAGIRLDPETVRVVLAAALALVGKLVLVFGFWAVTPRMVAVPVAPHEEPQRAEAAPAAQPAPKRPAPPAPKRAKRPQVDPSLNLAIEQLERELGSGG